MVVLRIFIISVLCLSSSDAFAASYATQVVAYTPGSDVLAGFDDPGAALGEPSRNNGSSEFNGQVFDNGDVTPFNAPFLGEHLVTVGLGGELIVAFDDPVLDDPLNPYGIDLLVFGNAFFAVTDFANPTAVGLFEEAGVISVSQDGINWWDVPGVSSDSLFPTLGFLDTPGPFDSGGTIPTDFTRPVDPNAEWDGLDFPSLVTLYDGSGGGSGVDLASVALPWIQYVRITGQNGSTPEVDGFADVTRLPTPSSTALLGAALLGLALSRRRT